MKIYDPGSAAELQSTLPSQMLRDARKAMREVDLAELERTAGNTQSGSEVGVAPTLQTACAAIGGLLLLILLGYVIAAMGLNLAGELPPGTELWSSDQGLL